MSNDRCPHCHSSRWYGCKFGCPHKQPPRGPDSRSYESWAAEQREQHARIHEKCMHSWSKHICPADAGSQREGASK